MKYNITKIPEDTPGLEGKKKLPTLYQSCSNNQRQTLPGFSLRKLGATWRE